MYKETNFVFSFQTVIICEFLTPLLLLLLSLLSLLLLFAVNISVYHIWKKSSNLMFTMDSSINYHELRVIVSMLFFSFSYGRIFEM